MRTGEIMKVIRFMLLMPWGRVGSNLLFAILRQSARMKLANEALNSLPTAPEQEAWFREFYEADARTPSQSFIGSKQNMLALRDAAAIVRMLREARVRVVRLRRRNLVKSAVSQIRAEQYAAKMAKETGERPWAVKKGAPLLGPSTIDPDILLKRIKIMETCDRRLMDAFDADEVLDIEYEDINAALDVVVARLREYLEVPQAPFRVPFEKATPDMLEKAIVNFEDVRAKLAQTPYAVQL